MAYDIRRTVQGDQEASGRGGLIPNQLRFEYCKKLRSILNRYIRSFINVQRPRIVHQFIIHRLGS